MPASATAWSSLTTGSGPLVCKDNFRCPRVICRISNSLALSTYPVDARGPYEGELLVESVYRVKGQSAAGIALSEVVFSELGAWPSTSFLSTWRVRISRRSGAVASGRGLPP